MALHYFCVSGAVTAVGPTAAQIDTSTTATGSRTTSIMATLYKSVVLKTIIALKVPAVADAISILDTSSSPVTLLSITVPTTGVPPYKLDIPMPSGGFLITTTQATGSYMLVFEGQANV